MGVRRSDDRPLLHAGDGPGQRPPRGLRGRRRGDAPAQGVRPAAVIAFQAVSLVWVVSEVVIAVTHSAPLRQAGQDRFSQPAVVVSIVVAVWAGYFAARGVPGAAIAQGRPFVIILGVALAAAGIVIRWWAVLSLGRFFTTRVMTRPGQTVVTAGPYGLV